MSEPKTEFSARVNSVVDSVVKSKRHGRKKRADSSHSVRSIRSGLSEVELYPMTNRLPTFDHASEAVDKFALPRVAKKGSSIRQGPHVALSCTYLVSVHGMEYFQLYLWLIKDWCWSQLHWVFPGIIFGTLAVLWSIMLLFLSLSARLYSEAFLGVAMFFWISSNYVWMVGEFWQENFIEEEEAGEAFYNACLEWAKSFSAAAVSTVTLYFAVLLPIGVFAYERKTNPIMARLCDDAPPPRLRFLFSSFREYENLHLWFWAIKDMCWVYEWPHGYMFGYGPTLILGIDMMYLFATHRDQFIDLVHALITFLWVLANGIWAYGEMAAENPNKDSISSEDWDAYNFPFVPDQPLLLARYACSWFFTAAVSVIVIFYAYWIVISLKCPPIEEDDDDEDWDAEAVGSHENSHHDINLHWGAAAVGGGVSSSTPMRFQTSVSSGSSEDRVIQI